MKSKKFLFILLTILYLEFIYSLFVFNVFSFKNILFITLFSLYTSIFIDLISSLFKPVFNKIFFNIIIMFLSVLFIAQFINYLFYGNIISIYSIFNGGQVFEYFGQILIMIFSNIIPIILFLAPVIILLILKKKIFIFQEEGKGIIIRVLSLIIVYLITLVSLNYDSNAMYGAKALYYDKHAPTQSAQTLGLITTMRLDLKRSLFGFKETYINDHEEEIILNEEVIEYNMIDINFNSLIENESNETIKNIHNYISQSIPSQKNEYTGMFKDMNLIAIVAEAFSPIAVNKELTPTLYKLVNNGFKFNDFYTPVYYVSTSDGEYVTLTSLLPKESTWSMSRSSKNHLPYSYGNLFKKMGYEAYAYHNGSYKYYDRHLSLPNMGYNFIGCGNGLKINCRIWPQSDIEMIDATFDLYKDSERFVTYYMTISGHLEYNFGGNNMARKNKDLVNDVKHSTAIKAYIATQIELDRALELLINKLEENNLLDNTVIVLSADHYPYGLKTSEMKEVMDIEDEKTDIHKNHLIIWNNQITEPIEVNKIGQSLDVLPTVLNLFGIEYDSRLLMGTDILSNSDGLVIFNDRSWISEKGKYNAHTKTFTPYLDNIDNEYIEEINNIVYNKYVISKNILDYNYYKYVLGG